jgi:hypothetical protein
MKVFREEIHAFEEVQPIDKNGCKTTISLKLDNTNSPIYFLVIKGVCSAILGVPRRFLHLSIRTMLIFYGQIQSHLYNFFSNAGVEVKKTNLFKADGQHYFTTIPLIGDSNNNTNRGMKLASLATLRQLEAVTNELKSASASIKIKYIFY